MTAPWMRAYLVAWLFWLTVALGCWGWELVHNLTGGNWGRPIRQILAAAAATLPLLALAFLPLIPTLSELYPWAREAEVAASPRLLHKQAYLNVPFFLSRVAGYFAVWIISGWAVRRAERQVVAAKSPESLARLQGRSGFALLLFCVTISFAAIDWCMSLEPHFTSVAYGILFLISLSLAGLASALAVEHGEGPGKNSAIKTPDVLNDQGNLLLAFVMLWAYVSFCQFLIIWYSNLPEEAVWYTRRLTHGFQIAAGALIGLNFVLPFVLLLSRDVKRSPRLMKAVAAGLLGMHWVEILWLVEPAFEGSELLDAWRALLVTLGMGVIWLTVFKWGLSSRQAEHAYGFAEQASQELS